MDHEAIRFLGREDVVYERKRGLVGIAGEGELAGREPETEVLISNADVQRWGVSMIVFSWYSCTVSEEDFSMDEYSVE